MSIMIGEYPNAIGTDAALGDVQRGICGSFSRFILTQVKSGVFYSPAPFVKHDMIDGGRHWHPIACECQHPAKCVVPHHSPFVICCIDFLACGPGAGL